VSAIASSGVGKRVHAELGIGKGEGNMFTGVKVFSATKAKEREELGEHT
jgi:hypothetical protein